MSDAPNYRIQALIFSEMTRWNVAVGLGTPAPLTYSFITPTPANTPAVVTDVVAFSAQQKADIVRALDAYTAVTGLTFFEVWEGSAGSASLQFAYGRFIGARADFAGFASSPYAFGDKTGTSRIFLNTANVPDLSPGSPGFQVALHEIGHAIGLKHPFDGSHNLPAGEDNTHNTVMSYTWMWPPMTTPGPYDVEALDYLYGSHDDFVASGIGYAWDAAKLTLATTGTSKSEALVGIGYRDVIVAGEGNDTIASFAGDDTLTAGDGNDVVLAGEGADKVDGGAGDDSISGGGGDDSLAGGSGADTLNGTNGQDTLAGGDGNDSLIAGYEASRLSGGNGADTLTGGNGNDTLGGGSGNDSLYGSWGNDSLSGGGGADTLDAFAGTDTLSGGTGNDSLLGGYGDGRLDGGEGADTIVDRGGSALMFGDNAGDVLRGASASRVDFSAAASGLIFHRAAGTNVFDIRVPGGVAQGKLENIYAITGTAYADRFEISYPYATLDGGAGIDTVALDHSILSYDVALSGGVIAVGAYASFRNIERIEFNAGSLYLLGGTGGDKLTGGAAADRLLGLDGADCLDGRGGYDTLEGGGGNDTFIVDSLSDRVVEVARGGDDLIVASVNYSLGDAAQVERLQLSGTGDLRGTGNDLANTLTGNDGSNYLGGLDGADLLLGGKGNDMLDGGAGSDTAFGGAGNDLYIVERTTDRVYETTTATGKTDGGGIDTVQASVSWTLGRYVENLVLTGADPITGIGNAANNTLTGNGASNRLEGDKGDDLLIGGGGADTLIGDGGRDTAYGGSGNDLYVVSYSKDVVREWVSAADTADAGGNDTIQSTVNWRLGDHIEVLYLTGSAAVNGTGNARANELRGNGAANVLDGGAGDDTLAGLGGNDLLKGRAGADVFSFAVGGGADTVADFTSSTDHLRFQAFGSKYDTAAEIMQAVAQVGQNTVITLHSSGSVDTVVTLANVSLASLQAADFWFA